MFGFIFWLGRRRLYGAGNNAGDGYDQGGNGYGGDDDTNDDVDTNEDEDTTDAPEEDTGIFSGRQIHHFFPINSCT